MRFTVFAALLVIGVGCASPGADPLPPRSVDEARALLDEIVDAGIERDWERLCANASGTCESELEGFEALAPAEPPRIVDTTVHQPMGDEDTWTPGGVLFVLCGTDAAGSPYESEVYVFDHGDRLLATAAVYWVGTRVSIAAPGERVTVGESLSKPRGCQ